RKRLVVIGRLDDDLVGADSVHAIEEPLALAVERAFNLERWKLIRHDTQVPIGPVRGTAVSAVRQHLRRREILVSGAKRTPLGSEQRGLFKTEVAGAFAPLGGDDHPPAGDGIFAQLRQCVFRDRYIRVSAADPTSPDASKAFRNISNTRPLLSTS